MKQRSAVFPYLVMQGSLWAIYGFIFSYANPYFTEKLHLSDTAAGLILCAATGLACLLQPLLTSVADRTRWNVRRLLVFCSGLTGAAALLTLVPVFSDLTVLLLFALSCTAMQVLPSFANALGMEGIRSGQRINFGLSRGVGSVCFGVSARLADPLISHMGMDAVALAGGITALIFMMSALAMPMGKQLAPKAPEEAPSGAGEFFRTQKRFALLLIAAVLLYIGHNVLSNCMFRIAQSKATAAESATAIQGTALLVAAVLELPMMFAFVHLVRKIRCDILLKISCVFMLVRLVLSLLLPGSMGLYIAQIAQMFGYALFAVCSVYYAGSVIPKKNVVKGQTYLGLTNTLGSLFAYALGGSLIDALGVNAMLAVCGLITLVGVILAFLSIQRVEQTVGA